jgi:hypothetical protein
MQTCKEQKYIGPFRNRIGDLCFKPWDLSPLPLRQRAFGVNESKRKRFKHFWILENQNTREDLHLLHLNFWKASVGLGSTLQPLQFLKSHTHNINELWVHESIANDILNTMVVVFSSNLTDLGKPQTGSENPNHGNSCFRPWKCN